MLEPLQFVSIALEAIIVILTLLTAIKKKKTFAYCLALTFAIYVFYDSAKQLQLSIPADALYALFFVATVSAAWAMWKIYKG